MDGKSITIEMKTAYMGWNKGKQYGFSETQAAHLVKIGAGKIVEDVKAPLEQAPARKGIINRMVNK